MRSKHLNKVTKFARNSKFYEIWNTKDDRIIFVILYESVLEQGDMQKGGFQRMV